MDMQCDHQQHQFEFIGNTKKQVNQYLKYYYQNGLDQPDSNTQVLMDIGHTIPKSNNKNGYLECCQHEDDYHNQKQKHKAGTIKKQFIRQDQQINSKQQQQYRVQELEYDEQYTDDVEYEMKKQKQTIEQTSSLIRKQMNVEKSFKNDSQQKYQQKKIKKVNNVQLDNNNRNNLKEVHQLELDHDFVRVFVRFFNNYFHQLKKAKLMFESLDKLYIFMKQFFSDPKTYRLLKDKKNVFEQRDNFEKIKEEVKVYLKILRVKLNESHFNLTFCLNWIEYLVKFRKCFIRIYKQSDKEFGVHESNQHFLSEFIEKAEIYYFQYANKRNLVDVENVYDILYQTIIERNYTVYLRDRMNKYQQIEDIQEDELLYKMISHNIQDAYIDLYRNRHENKENHQFSINLDDLKVIIARVFRNRSILITKSSKQQELNLQYKCRKNNTSVIDKSINKSVNKSNNKSMIKSTNKSVNRSSNNKSVIKSVNKSSMNDKQSTTKTSQKKKKKMVQNDSQKRDQMNKNRNKVNSITNRKLLDSFAQQQEEILERLHDIDEKIKGKMVSGNVKRIKSGNEIQHHESQNRGAKKYGHHLDRLIESANDYDELQLINESGKIKKDQDHHNDNSHVQNLNQKFEWSISNLGQNDNVIDDDYEMNDYEVDHQIEQEIEIHDDHRIDDSHQMDQGNEVDDNYGIDQENQSDQEIEVNDEHRIDASYSMNDSLPNDPQSELKQSELMLSLQHQSMNRIVQQFRTDSNTYQYLLRLLRNDDIIRRILEFLMPCQTILILNKEILQIIVQHRQSTLNQQKQVLKRRKTNLETKIQFEQNNRIVNQQTGDQVDVYEIIQQVEDKVNYEQQLEQESLFEMYLTEEDLILIQQDAILSKVIILCYILNEHYENLQMNNDTNQFMFTSTEYFLNHTINQILIEFNKKSELNEQKVMLINLLFNQEQFEQLKERDILASAISPVFYFLDLFVQCYMSMIGVGFDKSIDWFQQGKVLKGYQIQEKLEQEDRFVDDQVEIYQRLNKYFVFAE